MSGDAENSAESPSSIRAIDNRSKTRPIGRTLAALAIAAVLFCALVVADRDRQIKNAQIDGMQQLRQWLQEYYDEWGFLPTAIPEEAHAPASQMLPYPGPDLLKDVQSRSGSQLIVTGPRRGLIQPKADGAAGIFLENGEFHVRWVTITEIRRTIEERQERIETQSPANSPAQD